MDTLAFYTEPVAGSINVFDVYWMLSRTKRGAYRCVVEVDVPADHGVVAELSAIQYSLEYDQVLGVERAGNALALTVSSGAIRKLSVFQSQKRHLIPFSIFLNTRFSDAVVSVSESVQRSDFAWSSEVPVEDKVVLKIDQPFPEVIQLYGIGSVRLSVHAVDAYVERAGAATRSDAWRQLKNLAKDSSIRQLRLPKDMVEKKLARWGFPAIDLYHRGTDWHFVVSDDDLPRRLLSMYQLKVARPDVVNFPEGSPMLIDKTVLLAPSACFEPPVFQAVVEALFHAGANIGLDRASQIAVGEDRLKRFKRIRPGALFFSQCGSGERVDAAEFVRSVRRHYGAVHHVVVAGVVANSLADVKLGQDPIAHDVGYSTCVQLVHAAKREVDAQCGVVLSLVGHPIDREAVAHHALHNVSALLTNDTLRLQVKCVDLALAAEAVCA